jgi:hypothetical protein
MHNAQKHTLFGVDDALKRNADLHEIEVTQNTLFEMRIAEAKEARTPGYISTATLRWARNEVARVSRKLAATPTRQLERRLQHLIARRDAIHLCLAHIEPGILHVVRPSYKRPPGVAALLSRLRYRLKLKRNHEPMLILKYEEQRELVGTLEIELEIAKAEAALAHDAAETALMERRAVNPNAHSVVGVRSHVKNLKDAANLKAKELGAARYRKRVARDRLIRCRETMDRLTQEISNIVENVAAIRLS